MDLTDVPDSVCRSLAEQACDYAYVFRVTAEGELVQEWLAPEFSALIGREPAALDWAAGWADIVVPADAATMQRHRRALAAGEGGEVEFQVVVGDGRSIGLRECAQPIRETESDGVRRVSGAGMRVAAPWSDSPLSTATGALLGRVIEHVPAAVYIKDRAGRYLMVNRRFLQIFQMSSAQVLGRTDMDLFPEAMARAFRDNDQQALAEGEPLEFDEWVVQDDGEHTYISLKFPIADVAGRIFGTCGVSTDITERKRMENALRESERYNRMLFEQSPIGLALCRMNGEMVDVNRAYARILGRTPEEVRGMTYWDMTPSEFVADERRALAQLADAGCYGPYEKQYLHRDGHRVPVRLSGMILERDGEKYIWSSAEDITERRRAEDLARQRQDELARVSRLSSLGEMAAGLAHELNQPLAALTNYAHGCLRRMEHGVGDPGEIIAALRQITAQAERASAIIRQLRRFLRKSDTRRSDADLNQIVCDAVELIIRDLERQHIVLELELAETSLRVRVDEVLIQQVIINLLLNGAEAMAQIAPDRRRLTLVTAMDAAGVRVCVQDVGIGLPGDAHLRVFEPFFSTKEHGMGMGLSISRSIVEQHGGRMWVEPTGGCGAQFCFVLPSG